MLQVLKNLYRILGCGNTLENLVELGGFLGLELNESGESLV